MHMLNHNTYFPDCGFPSTIIYGNDTIPNGTEYNATAIYTCGENRGLVGKEANHLPSVILISPFKWCQFLKERTYSSRSKEEELICFFSV